MFYKRALISSLRIIAMSSVCIGIRKSKINDWNSYFISFNKQPICVWLICMNWDRITSLSKSMIKTDELGYFNIICLGIIIALLRNSDAVEIAGSGRQEKNTSSNLETTFRTLTVNR